MELGGDREPFGLAAEVDGREYRPCRCRIECPRIAS